MEFQEWKNRARTDGTLPERAIARIYKDQLNRSSPFAVVDGGAHKGYHTFQFAALPNCQKVIAVEADPFTYRAFAEQVAAHKHGSRVLPVYGALQDSEERERISFSSSESHPGRSGISEVSFWREDASVHYRPVMDVPATTIDKLTKAERLPIDFIKLDLEGGEFNAIVGAGRTMQKDRPLIVFENGNRSLGMIGKKAEDLFAIATARSYRVVGFDAQLPAPDQLYGFWYAWLVPEEKVASVRPSIEEAIGAT